MYNIFVKALKIFLPLRSKNSNFLIQIFCIVEQFSNIVLQNHTLTFDQHENEKKILKKLHSWLKDKIILFVGLFSRKIRYVFPIPAKIKFLDL